MSDVLKVNELEVRAVVSGEKDPYGQEGFFALFANILTSDEEQTVVLNTVKGRKESIIVRCGTLEIQGKVTKCSKGADGFKAVLAIDDIKMLK